LSVISILISIKFCHLIRNIFGSKFPGFSTCSLHAFAVERNFQLLFGSTCSLSASSPPVILDHLQGNNDGLINKAKRADLYFLALPEFVDFLFRQRYQQFPQRLFISPCQGLSTRPQRRNIKADLAKE
jgi:hypothetical protein